MDTIASRDGTPIAYERSGAGPPLVLISGAMTTSTASGPLAELLSPDFDVIAYDRRGRGASGDTAPYAVEREVEDIAALIGVTGGVAGLYGMSSGGALALEAAASGLPVSGLAVYEPPFALDEAKRAPKAVYGARLAELLAADDRSGAVELFMTTVGLSPQLIAGARQSPMWPGLEAVSPTLAYDDAVLGDGILPVERFAAVAVPALVLAGGASPASMRDAARATAEAMPDATYLVLEDQTHDVDPRALAQALRAFFG